MPSLKKPRNDEAILRIVRSIFGPDHIRKSLDRLDSELRHIGRLGIRGSIRVEESNEIVLELRIAPDDGVHESVNKLEQEGSVGKD